MLSVIRWIVQIAVLAVVIFWLTEQHGYVNIVWNDMEEFQISLAFCIIAVFLFALIVHLLLRFFSFLIRGPILWQAKRKLDKLNHGQNLLSQALVALFCGDCAKAKSLAASAGKNIDNTMLANWIQATACSANFDNKTAKEIFGKLAQDSEAAPLGYRGLIEIAMQKKNFPEVDRVVSEYYHVRPGAPWLSRMKMLGAIRHHDYERAAKELKIVENSKIMNEEEAARVGAALSIAISRIKLAHGEVDASIDAARHAIRLRPDWTPAVIQLCEVLVASERYRAAKKIIERSWKDCAHPQLYKIMLSLADSPLEGFKQIEKLCKETPQDNASHIAIADAAIAADIWGEARRNLILCINSGKATKSVFKMLSRLEREERHDERAALIWLTKATDAVPDPSWICTSCNQAHEMWQPNCSVCNEFNTMIWQSAGISDRLRTM